MAGWSMVVWSVIQNTSPNTAAARPSSCTQSNSHWGGEQRGGRDREWRVRGEGGTRGGREAEGGRRGGGVRGILLRVRDRDIKGCV